MILRSGLNEDFLHFVWKTLYFDTSGLLDRQGRPVRIIRQGIWNRNQGPDFMQAQIAIGEIEWYGNIEIHLRTEDWYAHKHQDDPGYNGVILHVVLDSGTMPVIREDGTHIPEISLQDHIPGDLIRKYDRLMLSCDKIPCEAQLRRVRPLILYNWIERLAVERMEEKAMRIKSRLKAVVSDWEQVVWEEVAAMCGGPVNQEAFRELARQVPARLMQKYRYSVEQQEALLFGRCGLLYDSSQDEYFQQMSREWRYLKAKHKFPDRSYIQMKFMRMRPASFPTIRISQLVSLFNQYRHLTDMLDPAAFGQLIKQKTGVSDYWKTHYRFGEVVSPKMKHLGKNQKSILIINTLIPLTWQYLKAHGRPDLSSMIEDALTRLAAEDNRIIRVFNELGIEPASALQTQGLIQLKKAWCDQRKCLNCRIGYEVLKG